MVGGSQACGEAGVLESMNLWVLLSGLWSVTLLPLWLWLWGLFSQAHKSQGCSGKASPLRPEPSWSGRMLMKWEGGVGTVVSAKSYCRLQYLGFLVFVFVFYFKAKSNC